MRKWMRAAGIAVPVVWSTLAMGAWKDVVYKLGEGEANRVLGPDRSYISVRPGAGEWTVEYGLANHFANLKGESIFVYSADTVSFHDHHADSGHAGKSSHLVFKIRLSEPVKSATWDIGDHGVNITAGASLKARYSTDGQTWKDGYVYPKRGQCETLNPPTVTLVFGKPTRVIYLGWFAEVPEGQTGWWNLGSTGRLVLTAVRPAAGSGTAAPEAKSEGLFGQRFIDNTFFGTTTHVNSELAIRLMKQLNMRVVRVDFHVAALFPAKGQYNFNPGNWVIDSADLGVKAGLDQLASINTAPAWLTDEFGRFPKEGEEKTFEDFMFRIASRYKGKITHWECMNEPNMAVWRERYVALLKAFSKGVKRADPANKVVLCGLAGVEAMQLEAIYRYGGKDYFDILNSHSYTRPRLPEEGGYIGLIQALHDVMRKYGDDKPLWVTEMGWNGVEPSMLEYLRSKSGSHRSYSCTEEDQARGLARLYLISSMIPWIQRVYFFHLHQEAAYTDVSETADHYMGLFTPWFEGQIRPKDAYFAIKTVFAVLNEATFKERIPTGDRIWALVYEKENEGTIALWSLDDGVTLKLDNTSTIKKVTSMVGTPVLLVDNELRLSGRPVYLSVDLKDLDGLKAQIRRARTTGAKDLVLTVGLDLAKSGPEAPVLDFEVTNTSNAVQAVPRVDIQVSSPWQAKPNVINDSNSLTPGETRTYPVSLTGPAAASGEISFDVIGLLGKTGSPVRVEKTIRYAMIPPRPANFKADGDLSEWASVTAIEIGSAAVQRQIIGWKGPLDCSGKWYAAWDKEGLTFAAEIKDDVHVQPCAKDNATDMWRSDSIQLGLDLAGDAKPSSNVPQYDSVNDWEFGFGLGKGGAIAYTWVNPQGKEDVVPLKHLAIVRDEAAKVTRYEVVIPWSVLGYRGSPAGKWMGMDVLVNDDDGQERKGYLEWAPGMGQMKDPSQFPKVRFNE